jgi:hypothetical protein
MSQDRVAFIRDVMARVALADRARQIRETWPVSMPHNARVAHLACASVGAREDIRQREAAAQAEASAQATRSRGDVILANDSK